MTSQKLFVSFQQFPWVCYSCWEDRTYCLPSVLFGYKNAGNPYKKPYQTCKTEKTFKKHQNVLTGTHKNRQIFFHRFAGEYSLLLPTNHCPFFEGGEHKLGKLGCIGSHFFKESSGQKGKGERKYTSCRKLQGWWDIFVLIYSLLTIMVTDTAYIYIYIYIYIHTIYMYIYVCMPYETFCDLFTFFVSLTMCSILFFL